MYVLASHVTSKVYDENWENLTIITFYWQKFLGKTIYKKIYSSHIHFELGKLLLNLNFHAFTYLYF